MKINTVNKSAVNRRTQGFTLIEMIGVLAVIAILAAVLIPKVFEAINNSRINNSAMTYNTVKTAIADHYAKFGGLPVDGSGAAPVALGMPQEQFDLILLKEAFLDKLFQVKIGDGINGVGNTRVRLFDMLAAPLTTASTVDGTSDTGFNLSGNAGALNEVTGSVCAEAVITGVTASDAKDLNDRLDGPALGSAVGVADLKGRVKFATPVAGTTTVYIYLTHR